MPGETFQTLKSKATQQAKQSGMSQSAAENYGSAMASQAAVQGNAGADFLGSNQQQITDTVKEITNNFDTITGSQGGPAGMTFTEAGDANIISSPLEVSQAQLTQSTNQNVLDQIAKRREVEKQVQEAGGVYNPQTGEVEYPPKKEGIFNFSGFKMPTLPTPVGMGVEFLKGLGSTDRFFKNLATKGVDGLTPEDNIILANLIAANKKNPNVFGDLSKYTTDDVDVEELGKRLQDAVRPLENTNYESLVNSYLSNKPTGIDSLTTMGSDLSNLFGDSRLLREDGSYTLEGLQKELGPQGLAYLKANDPKTYYSFTQPQTSGGLEELAQFDLSTLGSSPKDRQLAARVVAAREATSGQGGGGGAGIPSLPQFQDKMDITKPSLSSQYSMIPEQYMGFFDSPFNKPVVGGMAITPVQLPDGSTIQFGDTGSAAQFQQYLDSIGVNYSNPGIVEKIANTPATGIPSLTPTSIDYASMGPQYGGYVNQGISDPRFASYFQNLQMFPRRS